jgi:hypothetical protein
MFHKKLMAGQIQRKKFYFQLDKMNNRKLQKSQQFIPDPSTLNLDLHLAFLIIFIVL